MYTPNVIEPSFGIDRILTAVYEHTFYGACTAPYAWRLCTEARACQNDSADASRVAVSFGRWVPPWWYRLSFRNGGHASKANPPSRSAPSLLIDCAVRPATEAEGKGKQKPGVLAFPAEIAPYKVRRPTSEMLRESGGGGRGP